MRPFFVRLQIYIKIPNYKPVEIKNKIPELEYIGTLLTIHYKIVINTIVNL